MLLTLQDLQLVIKPLALLSNGLLFLLSIKLVNRPLLNSWSRNQLSVNMKTILLEQNDLSRN